MHLHVAISYIRTSTVIEIISCTDGPQATGLVGCGQCYVFIYIYKLSQLIKNFKVSDGGLIVTL